MATWQFPQEWSEWVEWLGAGLHGRCRWRLPILLSGILFATGRRTVASWLRVAGISTEFSDYYYFIAAVGRKAKPLATRLLILLLRHLPSGDHILFALDDTPTKRYGPKVQGAGIHHNPTPGPADAEIPLRTYLGDFGLDRAASAVGDDWLAVAGDALRPAEGHCRSASKAGLEVPHETPAGCGTGVLGVADRGRGGKTAVDRGRRGLRQAAFPEALAYLGRGGLQPTAEGCGLVQSAAKAARRESVVRAADHRPTARNG